MQQRPLEQGVEREQEPEGGVDVVQRLAVTATVKTSLPDQLVLMQPVILTLKKYMAEVARNSGCSSVAVVFESSERADDAVTQHFGNLVVERNGTNVPVEHCR